MKNEMENRMITHSPRWNLFKQTKHTHCGQWQYSHQRSNPIKRTINKRM